MGNIFKQEPAVVIGLIASVIVALAHVFHIVLDQNTVDSVLTSIIPLIVGFITRAHVTPTAKLGP